MGFLNGGYDEISRGTENGLTINPLIAGMI